MTTVKELKKWLDRFPDETEVRFGIQGKAGNYQAYGPVNFVSPKLDDSDVGDGWEYVDLRGNQFVKEGDSNFGKCFLDIGAAN